MAHDLGLRIWRIMATGLSFAIFGMGGIVLGFLVLPSLNFVYKRNPQKRTQIARRIVQKSFQAFVALMKSLGLLKLEISGIEKLRQQGQLILANHPSLIDIVILISLIPNADCVIKAGVFKNFFMRGPVLATNYVCNDSGPSTIDRCIKSLNEGGNLVIFPEGTRTPSHGAPKLQRGAAHIAIRGERDITPIRIAVSPPSLGKNVPWWHMQHQMQFSIDIQDIISVKPFLLGAGAEARATRQLTDYLFQFFFKGQPDYASTRT